MLHLTQVVLRNPTARPQGYSKATVHHLKDRNKAATQAQIMLQLMRLLQQVKSATGWNKSILQCMSEKSDSLLGSWGQGAGLLW